MIKETAADMREAKLIYPDLKFVITFYDPDGKINTTYEITGDETRATNENNATGELDELDSITE